MNSTDLIPAVYSVSKAANLKRLIRIHGRECCLTGKPNFLSFCFTGCVLINTGFPLLHLNQREKKGSGCMQMTAGSAPFFKFFFFLSDATRDLPLTDICTTSKSPMDWKEIKATSDGL